MSYRPITDVWILGRPKVKYYGAYPSGFLERARRLLGVSLDDPVLHVCGGRVRDYPIAGGVGRFDKTVDMDPDTFPDFCIDVRKLASYPMLGVTVGFVDGRRVEHDLKWPAVLTDPPYTEQDAAHYLPGALQFPKLGVVFRNCCEVVRIGGRVGVLHYEWPGLPKLSDGSTMREVAVIAVGTGRRQRARWFTVFEKFAPRKAQKERRQHVEPVQVSTHELPQRAEPGL